ncbi:MAG: hypothetical protein GVY24_06590, partial [Planctomycetes bacterium]|nr:hypothetical protein [Planctomycetota bacterium]
MRRICRSPIFIVGCGHSGTTLLLRLIGAHPQIMPLLEETWALVNGEYQRLHGWDLSCFKAGKQRWVEKTPSHIHH